MCRLRAKDTDWDKESDEDSLAAAFEQEADKRVSGQFSTTLIPRSPGEELMPVGIYLQHPHPSPLLLPHRAVQVQLEALQMNDFPDIDDGCRHAYRFAIRGGRGGSGAQYASSNRLFLLKEGKNDASVWSDREYVDEAFDDARYAKAWCSGRLLCEEEFVDMVREHYGDLVGMDSHRWGGLPHFSRNGMGCSIPVIVERKSDGKEDIYVFQLSRVGDGEYRDCWMTIRVYRV